MIRDYAGGAKRTTIVGDITAASTTITITSGTGYPTGATGPFVMALALEQAAEEKILVTSRSGNTLTVAQRGYDDTTASAHAAGTTADHVVSAIDLREANAHVNDTTTDVHPQYVTAAEGNAAYVRQAGGDTITASGAAVVPLVVKGASGQTGNLLEARDSASVRLLDVDPNGNTQILGAALAVGGSRLDAAVGTGFLPPSAAFHIRTRGTLDRGLIVRGAASQSANLAEFQNSAGTVLASVDSFGDYSTSQVVQAGQELAGGFIGGTLSSRARSAGERAIVARGAASQSANLFEAQNSAGTVLASVSAAGQLGQTDGGTFRTFVLGDPNSAGAGFRTVRVVN